MQCISTILFAPVQGLQAARQPPGLPALENPGLALLWAIWTGSVLLLHIPHGQAGAFCWPCLCQKLAIARFPGLQLLLL